MDLRRHCLLAALCALLPTASATAQPAPPAERVIRMSGAVPEAAGQQVAVHFALYDAESGGHLLWQETQTLSIDASGQFTAFLGATSLDGLPLEAFATGAPRWLETSRPGGPAAPRTLLAAVPYAVVAATAANATTLAGRPASDFQLTAAARRRSNGPALDATATADLDAGSVNSGTVNYIGKFTNSVDLGNSQLFDTGFNVGLGTVSPLDKFHVQFSNSAGSQTGLAVQNLGNTTSSYSGMLFYDHTGALRQFQGYNNGTGEYRINNISPTGSINFMIGSTSRFKVDTTGRVGIGETSPAYTLDVRHGGNGDGLRVRSSTSYSLIDIDGADGEAGMRFAANGSFQWLVRNRGVDNVFEIWRMNGGGSTLRIRPDNGYVGIGPVDPVDRLQVDGNMRLFGCLMNFSGTVVAGACSSDARFKRDVAPFPSLLDRFVRLTPVNYFWKADEFPNKHFGTERTWGLIAQDVQAVFPELVATDADGFLTVDYSRLPLMTVQAVKELKAENDDLKRRLAALESTLEALAVQLAARR